ncbi:MAG: TonB-dependent receptor, partial [bacterium]|nr:TonB-dependent receptor [bacterium]
MPYLQCLMVGLIVFWGTAFAQTATLAGRVTDAQTGASLPGTNIAVASADTGRFSYQTTVETTGRFEIQEFPAGEYILTATHIGYHDAQIDFQVEAGETRTVRVSLKSTVFTLEKLVVYSVSRKKEKAVDAPASVHVLEATEIQSRPALTPVEHLLSVGEIDVIRTGLNQTRVAVRGFNNPLADADKLLMLTDYRNVGIPSMRYNISRLLSTANQDIDRIEVVSGPGSALYGPNAANGVVHILTKSPFDSKGTQLSITAGERNLLMGAVRHADVITPKAAYRISARYYQGTDWKSTDEAEPATITKGFNGPNGRTTQGSEIPNQRNFDVEHISVDARIDIRPSPDVNTVLSSGYARATSLDFTDIGAAQSIDWSYWYTQGRISYENFFAQTFLNVGDLGKSYMLRTGDLIIDKSTLLGMQLQHGAGFLEDRQRFTYGADAFFTRPDTRQTVNGRNETTDDINEIGVYLQSETRLSDQLTVVAAARLDDHNHLKDRIFSPRAALVFQPKVGQNFRATYNRSFTTPPNSMLFLDINISPTLGGLPYAMRGLGVSTTGYTFQRNDLGGAGGLFMQSPFTPEENGGRSAYLPAEATQMWPVVVGLMQAQNVNLSALPAPGPDQVNTHLKILNLATQAFDEVAPEELTDLNAFRPTINNTFEIGYKGTIGTDWFVTADVYHSKIENFARFDTQTPNVFLDAASLTAYLQNFMPAENAGALAQGIAQIPLGTVMLQEAGAQNPADLILTYRSFPGNVSLYGANFSLNYFATPTWQLGGNYSYISKNFFQKSPKQLQEIALNAPKHKLGGSLRYFGQDIPLNAQLRMNYVDGYPVASGVYIGQVDS